MPSPPYLSLGAEIAREQDRILGDKQLSERDLLRGLGRTQHRVIRRYRQITIGLIGVLAVASTVVATIVLNFPVVRCAIDGTAATLVGRETLGRWVVAPANQPTVVTFSDGSMATLVAASRMRLLGTSRRGAALAVESGSVDLRVAGSRLTEYLVGVGPFGLAMAEGRVEVSWDPLNERLALFVRDGYVVISGCQFGVGRSVMAGNELNIHCIVR
jgi:hypothetical protein